MKELENNQIHFHAVFLPNQHEFNVTVRFGKRKRLFEKMTIAKFLRFARSPKTPIKVAGTTISFEGDEGETERVIRRYLKEVADAYIQTRYQNN